MHWCCAERPVFSISTFNRQLTLIFISTNGTLQGAEYNGSRYMTKADPVHRIDLFVLCCRNPKFQLFLVGITSPSSALLFSHRLHYYEEAPLIPPPLMAPLILLWQGKKSSSSRRRGGKERSGGGHESSSSSRRRRGSKGSRDAPDDNPTIAALGGGSSGNKEGWDRSSPAGDVNANVNANVNVNIEPEDKDDSYLFMGATAVSRFSIPPK